VSVEPGLTAFTQIRRSRKSVVQVRANERTAALVALYTLTADSAKRFADVSEYLQTFETFCLKSETGGFENINPNIRMRPLENLSARPAVTGLQFAQMVRALDQSQPA
jgi:hypothetical protein